MGAFQDATDIAMAHWFGPGLADPVTLDGETVTAHIVETGTTEEHRTRYDYLDLELPNATAAGLDYKTATLTAAGHTWKRPQHHRGDGFTTVLRWRRNERHIHRGG